MSFMLCSNFDNPVDFGLLFSHCKSEHSKHASVEALCHAAMLFLTSFSLVLKTDVQQTTYFNVGNQAKQSHKGGYQLDKLIQGLSI